MEISKITKALLDQKRLNLPGNLYHKTQVNFAYSTNFIEGSTITEDETASIYDNGTLIGNESEWFNVGDYKKLKNYVGNITTTLPKNVSKDMKELLN